MKNIQALRRNSDGICSRVQVLITPTHDGIALEYPAGSEPVTATGRSQIIGWAGLDGPAIEFGSLIIPASQLPHLV
jgi:hypothetical protein